MNENIDWDLLSKGKIKSKTYLTSYIEKREMFDNEKAPIKDNEKR